MEARQCLARSLTSPALLRASKSANGPRRNSFRPDSPSRHTHTVKTQKNQPHRTGSDPFRMRPLFSIKSPSRVAFIRSIYYDRTALAV